MTPLSLENTWNLPTTAFVETLSWESLGKDQLAGAQSIGFATVEAEDIWDCFQNHYDDYDWKELVVFNLSQYFLILGWTQGSWYEVDPPPPSENTSWVNLTAAEQEAAVNICFFEYSWDEVNIANWTDLEGTTTTLSLGYVTPIPLEPVTTSSETPQSKTSEQPV